MGMSILQLYYLVQIARLTAQNRAPGDYMLWPFIDTGFLIEIPSLYLLRTTMVTQPENPDTVIGLPKYYRAGYVAFGHK